MCGIAGFVNFSADRSQARDEDVLTSMMRQIAHRGPDDSGQWFDADAGVGFGHQRLSIIDLSKEGRQPMISPCHRYVLVFNGEIYNFTALREKIEASGFSQWRGTSDTEVLLQAFAAWGVEATLEHVVGMFAFALWDCGERRLYLGRDRLGEKPLYYGWTGGYFVFGSELKALRVHPQWAGRIDQTALNLYVRFNYIPAPYSIYEAIYKLPPGSVVSIGWERLLETSKENRHTPLQAKPYWCARDIALKGVAEPFPGDEREMVDELDRMLRDAVRQQMIADVPLGAFLSGGVDSSTVVALMQAQSSSPIKTFTIGVEQPDFNEAEHAKSVAAHLGTEHTELYVTPRDALNVIPLLPQMYDEPFADSSQIPTYLVSKLTRQHVTVSLSGDGGDELFSGYNHYFLTQAIWNKFGWMPSGVRLGVSSLLKHLPSHLLDHGGEWLSSQVTKYGRSGKLSDKLKKLAMVLPAETPEELYLLLSSIWGASPPTVAGGNDQWSVFSALQWGDGFPSFIEEMMFLDMVSFLPDDILVKVDRAAMHVSLETRVPLLDHRVCEFAWRVPMHMKVRDGKGKWLLRQVLYKYVPEALIERPKRGFDVPIEDWLRGPLRDWAEHLLNEKRLCEQGLLDAQAIRAVWHEHLSGQCNWQFRLWNILMLQSWLDSLE